MRLEQCIEVNAPRQVVWDVLADADRHPLFMAGLTRWDVQNGPTMEGGTRIRPSPMVNGIPPSVCLPRGRVARSLPSKTKRSPSFPDLPTIGEFYPGFENSIWLGLFGPANMPEDVLSRLRAEVRQALEDPTVKSSLIGKGSV